MKNQLVITYVGAGFGCVLGEGTINGVPFYFRARIRHATFSVGHDPLCDPIWQKKIKWSNEEYGADGMSEETARRLIERSAKQFVEDAADKDWIG